MNRQKENFVDTRELVENSSNLAAILEEQGIRIDENAADSLLRYYEMIVEKNKVMNLTRITEFEDAVRKHFADSLAIENASGLDLNQNLSVLDLGTGAGFPGIPLALAFPKLKVTMIDTVGKKIQFVNEVINALNIENAVALHARAEEMAFDKKHREQYDLCVSRAVANLSTLSEYCLPFIKTGGYFIAYKAGDSGQEIDAAANAIKILGGSDVETIKYSLYDMERVFVKIKKGKHTPCNYPRKAGTPAKNPIS